MPDIHESGENYLETILVLRERGVDVRSIDIVHEMELSKPSVSRAMSILRSGGFIEVDKDGYITLTEPGEEIAQRIYERHRVLTDWLIGIGVDEKTAAEDACKLEHDISSESFDKLKKHIKERCRRKYVTICFLYHSCLKLTYIRQSGERKEECQSGAGTTENYRRQQYNYTGQQIISRVCGVYIVCA